MKNILVVLLLILAGCESVETKTAVSANCSTICYMPCVNEDGSIDLIWAADPALAGAWDELSETVVNPLADKLRVCEARRRSCVLCLNNLRDAGVIQ